MGKLTLKIGRVFDGKIEDKGKSYILISTSEEHIDELYKQLKNIEYAEVQKFDRSNLDELGEAVGLYKIKRIEMEKNKVEEIENKIENYLDRDKVYPSEFAEKMGEDMDEVMAVVNKMEKEGKIEILRT